MKLGAILHFTDNGELSQVCIMADNERAQLVVERTLAELGILEKKNPAGRRGRQAAFPSIKQQEGTNEK